MAAAKKAAKKATKKVAKKKAVEVKQTIDLWELSCALEELANKIDNVRSALDLIAQNIMNDPESGAIWMVVDALQVHIDTLEQYSGDVMKAHRESLPLEQQKENEHLWKLTDLIR